MELLGVHLLAMTTYHMKIAFFSDSFYPRKCGVTTYLTVTIQELVKRGHEMLMVVPKHKNSLNEKEMEAKFGCKFILLPSVSVRYYPDIKLAAPTPRSAVRVRRFKPDLIHFHTPGPVGVEGLLVAKALKVPIVVTFHTYFMEPEGFRLIGLKQEGRASSLLNKSLWKVAEGIHKPANAIVAPTEYVAKDLQARWPKQRIETIHGGVRIDSFRDNSMRKDLRESLGITNQEFAMLWVGRLSFEKNLDLILEAFALTEQEVPKIKLVMIGDGPARESLELLTQALELPEKVIFTRAISYQELVERNYYSLADMFVTASTWDTQGLSIIEAMAAGLPVVAPNVKAMPELVEGIGELVEPNNSEAMAEAILKLLRDDQLRVKYSKQAKVEAKSYSVESSVDELLELYQDLI